MKKWNNPKVTNLSVNQTKELNYCSCCGRLMTENIDICWYCKDAGSGHTHTSPGPS